MCKIGDWCVLVFLFLCSLTDVRTKQIPTALLAGMSGVTGILCLYASEKSLPDIIGGIGVGVLFFVLSRCTREAFGYGDSWIILLLGGYLGGTKVLELAVGAFFLSGVFALAGIVLKKWKKTVTLPFVPFLTAAYIGAVIV